MRVREEYDILNLRIYFVQQEAKKLHQRYSRTASREPAAAAAGLTAAALLVPLCLCYSSDAALLLLLSAAALLLLLSAHREGSESLFLFSHFEMA